MIRNKIGYKVTFLSGEALTVEVDPMKYFQERREAVRKAATELGFMRKYTLDSLMRAAQIEKVNKLTPGRKKSWLED